mmetsp:Transcript_24803/g.56301  ORF Transcript_24803/g.56301 Transcript_24803/m.56301 type:complete len:322 (+) Transcript_24803:910-1875(+)
MYSDGSLGGRNMITSSSPSTSNPRAAMGVATKILIIPDKNMFIAASRWPCSMSGDNTRDLRSMWGCEATILPSAASPTNTRALPASLLVVSRCTTARTRALTSVGTRQIRCCTWSTVLLFMFDTRSTSSAEEKCVLITSRREGVREAENNTNCTWPGACLSRKSTSLVNASANIMSASSMTTVLNLFSCKWPSLTSLHALPGVATINCDPLRSNSICVFIVAPPYSSATVVVGLTFSTADPICLHSSLVGTKISTEFSRLILSTRSRSINGSKYAMVFPVPVLLVPTKLRPRRIGSKALACISVSLFTFSPIKLCLTCSGN